MLSGPPAAFASVMAGKQVAVVVPTTLLARQHYRTFAERFRGMPVNVAHLSRFVPAAEVKTTKAGLAEGGIDIVVIGNNGQAIDLAQFTSLGVDPTGRSTIAVKSMQHFRAAFEPIAREVVEVDTGALCTKDFKSRPYANIRRPIWPLDPI